MSTLNLLEKNSKPSPNRALKGKEKKIFIYKDADGLFFYSRNRNGFKVIDTLADEDEAYNVVQKRNQHR
jgi:hypothetical protein